MLVELLRGCPNETISRKVGAEPLQRLPCHHYCSILRLVEEGPEEGRLVPGDVRSGHQPFSYFLQIGLGHHRVSGRGDKVNVGHLNNLVRTWLELIKRIVNTYEFLGDPHTGVRLLSHGEQFAIARASFVDG